MARTRSEIEAIVELHTGKTDKDTLMHNLCDNALRLAQMKHFFHESVVLSGDETLTEDALSVAVPTTDLDSNAITVKEILSIRIVNTADDRSSYLPLRNSVWWDENVLVPADNMKGWPLYGLHYGSNIYFDRPLDADLTARFRVVKELSFAGDATECPVPDLQVFVEHFVTAHVFMSIEAKESYLFWLEMALGTATERARGILGGSLRDAIQSNQRQTAMEQDLDNGFNGLRHPGIGTSGYTDPFHGFTLGATRWNVPRRYW